MKDEGKNETTTADIVIRKNESLPALDFGWLKLKDHFIATVGPNAGAGEPLKNLLVIADATLQPQTSFSKHPHMNMEVLTWIVKGTLHHQDDKAPDQYVPAKSLQMMSARDGIFHAEGNAANEELRLLQIWVRPAVKGGEPEIKTVKLEGKGFQLLAGPENAPLVVRQKLWLYAADLAGAEDLKIAEGKFGYAVFLADMKINDVKVSDGDAVMLNAGHYLIEGRGQIIVIEQPR